MAKQSHGLIVYEIFENGALLNGIFTNNFLDKNFHISNEIAKKIDATKDIIGTYECKYIEVGYGNINVNECTLIVTSLTDIVYEFVWRNSRGKDIFEGFGIKVGKKHISVSYHSI